jgi:Alcohol dehydrogenase GroES-like domain
MCLFFVVFVSFLGGSNTDDKSNFFIYRRFLCVAVYCGICHTDVHFADGSMTGPWATKWPIVPGHELAGIATKVSKFNESITGLWATK